MAFVVPRQATTSTTTTRTRGRSTNNHDAFKTGRLREVWTVSFSTTTTTTNTPFSSPPPGDEEEEEEDARATATTVTTTTTATTPPLVSTNSSSNKNPHQKDIEKELLFIPPWNNPELLEKAKSSNFRARQHVNPLARRFQQPTVLSEQWPRDMFTNVSRPLFLDIGCSRGGFLVEMALQQKEREQQQQQQQQLQESNKQSSSAQTQKSFNYLGLEIRPIVVHQAQERVSKHQLNGILGFVGCNANVDLERLLSIYQQECSCDNDDGNDESMGTNNNNNNNNMNLDMVTIQFPDPHFKSHHAKRRVVTTSLVTTLAKFMKPTSTVFLQSDIAPVLEDMRLKFQEQDLYFVQQEEQEDEKEVLVDYSKIPNPVGIPTEREVSVLDKGLPVYRVVFRRTAAPFVVVGHDQDDEDDNENENENEEEE
jgi:tRNA (guanine-N7-)-methyltransferase